MNIVWRLPSEALEDASYRRRKRKGLSGLKGHRSVGGIRASIYNAITLGSRRGPRILHEGIRAHERMKFAMQKDAGSASRSWIIGNPASCISARLVSI